MLIHLKPFIDLPSFWDGVLKGIAAPVGVYFAAEQAKETMFDVELISLPDSFDLQPLEADWRRVGADIVTAADVYGEAKPQATHSK